MTDNEIIKALERVKEQYGVGCYECKYKRLCKNKVCPFHTCDYALDLIKRQQAEIGDEKARKEICAEVIARQDKEIANLEVELKAMRGAANGYKAEAEKLHPYKLHYGNLRMEIAKEFADRLKAKGVTAFRGGLVVTGNNIDNLLKEMEKECEGKQA